MILHLASPTPKFSLIGIQMLRSVMSPTAHCTNSVILPRRGIMVFRLELLGDGS